MYFRKICKSFFSCSVFFFFIVHFDHWVWLSVNGFFFIFVPFYVLYLVSHLLIRFVVWLFILSLTQYIIWFTLMRQLVYISTLTKTNFALGKISFSLFFSTHRPIPAKVDSLDRPPVVTSQPQAQQAGHTGKMECTVRHGPNTSLRCGPNPSLCAGPNPSLLQ